MQKPLENTDVGVNTLCKRWFCSMTITSASFILLYLWKIEGMNAAGNLLLFWLWLGVVLWTWVVFFGDGTDNFSPRVKSLDSFHVLTSIMLIAALVWFDHFVTASFYTWGLMARSAYVSRCQQRSSSITKK